MIFVKLPIKIVESLDIANILTNSNRYFNADDRTVGA